MADTNPTPRVPQVGDRPSVRVDDQFAADLAVIMRTGCTYADAVRAAVGILADICANAWASGAYPPGVAPAIEGANLTPYRIITGTEQVQP